MNNWYQPIALISAVPPDKTLSSCGITPVFSDGQWVYSQLSGKDILEIGWFWWSMAHHVFKYANPNKYISVDPLYADKISAWVSILQEEILHKSSLEWTRWAIKQLLQKWCFLDEMPTTNLLNYRKRKLWTILSQKKVFFDDMSYADLQAIYKKFSSWREMYESVWTKKITKWYIERTLSELGMLSWWESDKLLGAVRQHKAMLAQNIMNIFDSMTLEDFLTQQWDSEVKASTPVHHLYTNYKSYWAVAQELPFPENKFDLTMINFLLYALDDSYVTCLKEVCRVTNPEWKIMIVDYPESEVFQRIPSNLYSLNNEKYYWFIGKKDEVTSFFSENFKTNRP